jgi:hypothetical protein
VLVLSVHVAHFRRRKASRAGVRVEADRSIRRAWAAALGPLRRAPLLPQFSGQQPASERGERAAAASLCDYGRMMKKVCSPAGPSGRQGPPPPQSSMAHFGP